MKEGIFRLHATGEIMLIALWCIVAVLALVCAGLIVKIILLRASVR